MSEEMLVRVSDAITDAIHADGCTPLRMARAAIEALRVPTQTMMAAGYRSASPCPTGQQLVGAWEAMIDEALKS